MTVSQAVRTDEETAKDAVPPIAGRPLADWLLQHPHDPIHTIALRAVWVSNGMVSAEDSPDRVLAPQGAQGSRNVYLLPAMVSVVGLRWNDVLVLEARAKEAAVVIQDQKVIYHNDLRDSRDQCEETRRDLSEAREHIELTGAVLERILEGIGLSSLMHSREVARLKERNEASSTELALLRLALETPDPATYIAAIVQEAQRQRAESAVYQAAPSSGMRFWEIGGVLASVAGEHTPEPDRLQGLIVAGGLLLRWHEALTAALVPVPVPVPVAESDPAQEGC